MTPSAVATLAQPAVFDQHCRNTTRLHQWERHWARTLEQVSPASIVFSVIGLLPVRREESWGAKLPRPAVLWETPQRRLAATDKREGILRIRALLGMSEMVRLMRESRVKPWEIMDLDSPDREFGPQDYLLLPQGTLKVLNCHNSEDMAGSYYGRFFAVPLRRDWTNEGHDPERLSYCQNLLAAQTYEDLRGKQ